MSIEQFPINEKASSNVKWARYDPVRAVVSIDFKNGAGETTSTYEYANFTRQDWEDFRASRKPGEHFAHFIRGKQKFPYRKIPTVLSELPQPQQETLF